MYKGEAFFEISGEDPGENLWWRAVAEVAVGWVAVSGELKACEEGEVGALSKGNGMKLVPRDCLCRWMC